MPTVPSVLNVTNVPSVPQNINMPNVPQNTSDPERAVMQVLGIVEKALYEEHVMSHAERNAYMHAMISNTTTAITTTPAPNAPAAKAKSAAAKAKAAAAKCDVPTPTAPGRPNTTTTVAQR